MSLLLLPVERVRRECRGDQAEDKKDDDDDDGRGKMLAPVHEEERHRRRIRWSMIVALCMLCVVWWFVSGMAYKMLCTVHRDE